MAAGDARQASIAAQRAVTQPRPSGARVSVHIPQTPEEALGIPPTPPTRQPALPNRAPYAPGAAPEQVAQTGGDVRVKAVQTQLRSLGYNVSVDGVMGPETRAAILLSHNGTVPNVIHSPAHAKAQAIRHVAQQTAKATVAQHVTKRASYTPYFKGQKPDHLESYYTTEQVGSQGVTRRHERPVYILPQPGPTGDATDQMNAQEVARANAFREKEYGVPGTIFRDTISSLVPTRVAHKLANGETPSIKDVGADVLNGALWASPGEVAPAFRSARVAVKAFHDEGVTRMALQTIREVRGTARTAKQEADNIKRLTVAAKAEQRAEGPVVSPKRAELEQALSQAPNISKKQRNAILTTNDINARIVAKDLKTTPQHAYELMWRGANFHDINPTADVAEATIKQMGAAPEVTNVAQTPDIYHQSDTSLERAARSLARSKVRTAAPPHATNQKAMQAMLSDLQQRAVEASDYKNWYANSAAGILSHVNGDKQAADKLAALIAVYSPRAEVYSKTNEWNNLDRAINAFDEYNETGQISPKWSISSHKEGEGDWQTFRAQQIMDGNFEWSGLKTNRFYRNFLQHIDPEKYAQTFGNEQFTTIDTWMRRAFGYPATSKTEERSTLFGTEHVPVGKKQEAITPAMYQFMDRATKAVADSLGWTPEEAQAAIWTSIKAESEGTPLGNAGFDFRDAFLHREARRARPAAPEQLALDETAATADTPRQSAVQDAIDASRKPDDGFTLTAGLNPDPGKDGYAVAYGAYEYREPAPLTSKGLLDFRNKHLALLRSDPTLRVGGWHNPDDGQVYLDISRVFPSLNDAMQFAHEQGQVAIFDRTNMDVVPTGLSPERADAIKANLRAQGQLQEQAANYDGVLETAWKSLTGKAKKALTANERDQAEQFLFDVVAKRAPELRPQLEDLVHDASLARSTPDPDLLFQDDALVQSIGDAHGRPVDRQAILDKSAGRDLEGLPKTRRSNADAQKIADRYMKDSGMSYTPPTTYAKVDPARARRIAEWYDQAVDAPHDPTVRAAYDAMARETMAQYRAIRDEGYIFEFYPDGVDPYPQGPSQAIDDLRSNRHMYVFPTDAGFGSLSEAQQAHPLLAKSGEQWGEKPATYNDIFRAVHDFMGHFKEGVGFRADGEENAWRAHSAMYSPDARRAMTAETRGQNSWVNYGPHGETNKTADQAATVYADQKAVLAPDWVVNDGSGQPKVLFQGNDTFPEEWVSESKGGFDQVYNDARDWLADIQWRNMEPEDIHDLPNPTVAKAIDRLYDGGMEQFISDSGYFPDWLAQASPRVKGAVERTAQGAVLHLFRGADTSTALHEMAHAVEPLMPASARDALKTTWQAHNTGESYDEFVARSMERYLMDGNVPVAGQKRTFRTLAKAMGDIYGISDRIPGGALNPEIRRVFDTWYAREAAADPRWARAVGVSFLHQEASNNDPLLEAAAMQHTQGGASVEDAARMFKIDPNDLRTHIESGAHEAEQARILSNADVGAGDAATEKTAQEYIDKWLNQEETPGEGFEWGDEDSLARTHEPSKVPAPWTRGDPNPLPLSPEEEVRQGLRGARAQRGRQEQLYSEARSERAGEAEAAMRAHGGMEGYIRALHELKGELPKINFAGFKELDSAALDHLFTHIQQHDALTPFQKIRAQRALLTAVEGRVPTKSEITLLENVFGKDTAKGLRGIPTKSAKFKASLMELLNVPRSLMASFDLSAPFRQGLVVSARHPKLFFRNFNSMVRSFGSERVYNGIMDDIVTRNTFPMMQKAKLAITEAHGELGTREEQYFGGNYAERIPVLGRGVKASERAYVAFLNKTRADVFDHLIRAAHAQGIDVQNEKFLRSLGTYINSATGRGTFNSDVLEKSMPFLNTMLFSPRLLASRLNFLNPHYYVTLDPFVRREALRSAIQLTGAVSAILSLAAYGGAQVVTDPRNADFAKIKMGNTRVDVLGGFQQPIRLIAQLVSGKAISSTTGDPIALGPEGPGKLSRKDILQRFFEGKLAPTPSMVNDWLKGTNFQGQPFSVKQEAVQHLVPLLAQDAASLYSEKKGGMNGIAYALGSYGVGAFGFGIQTYGAVDPSKKPTTKLQQQAKDAGLPAPPQDVLIDVKHKAQLDSISQKHAGDPVGRMTASVQYYEQTTGDHSYDAVTKKIANAKDEKDAATLTHMIRTFLIGKGLSDYEKAIKAANGG